MFISWILYYFVVVAIWGDLTEKMGSVNLLNTIIIIITLSHYSLLLDNNKNKKDMNCLNREVGTKRNGGEVYGSEVGLVWL